MSTVVSRFLQKVRRGGDDECWLWAGFRNKGGYGKLGGRRREKHFAHRVAWETWVGLIPGGVCVLHHCDNPPCCNPKHLFIGSQADNMKDMAKKGRRLGLGGLPGVTNPNAKLTEQEVAAVRGLLLEGKLTHREIGVMLGVSRAAISHISCGNTWKH